MSDLSQKSSGELTEELQKVWQRYTQSFIPKNFLPQEIYNVLNCLSNLVLAQQKEIEQLKAELKELKK